MNPVIPPRRHARPTPFRAWLRLGAWVLAGLLASTQAPGAPVLASASASQGASATALRSLSDQIAELDKLGRARPAQAIAQLGALLDTLPNDHPQWLAAMTLRGYLQGQMHDREGNARTAQAIEALKPLHPDAAAAAALVKAELLLNTGPVHRADSIASEGMSELRPDSAALLRLRLVATLASAKEERGRFNESLPLRQQALKLAENMGPLHQGKALADMTYGLIMSGQMAAAKESSARNLDFARQVGDDLLLSHAYNTQTFIDTAEHDSVAELANLQAALKHARQAGSPRRVALGLANLADHYLISGQYDVAVMITEEAMALNDPYSIGLAKFNHGIALIGLHRLQDGLRFAREGLTRMQQTGYTADQARFTLELGGYLEKSGYLADAVRTYQQQRQLAYDVSQQAQQQAILELQEANDADRRQRELDLLQRENILKNASLEEQGLRQRLWAAGALISALVVAVCVMLVLRLRRHNAQLREGNALLRTLSEHDALTGLGNRRQLQRLLRAEGQDDQPFEAAMLLIDIDHFKRINDQFGHAAGDAVLVEVARRLRTVLRPGDTLVRWGGEEFLIVAPELGDAPLVHMAQRVLSVLGSQAVTVDGRRVQLTASLGHASFPLAPSRLVLNWERALALVDTALYLAKAHGRNLAYGVRAVTADNETELAEISHNLEAAWQAGRVQLIATSGPALDGQALIQPVPPAHA